MLTLLKKQAGGTLLGIIIGLVIGLGIAVVVAMTINKTPVPLMDRGAKNGKPAELSASPNDDPNKPMYGSKDAVREAAKEFAPEATPAPTAAPATPAPQGKPVSAAPQAQAPEAKADAKTADSAASDGKWIYYLQAGAYRNQADAEAAKARLALQGFEASVMEHPSDGGSLYRVRIGPFDQVEAMNQVRSKLTGNGMDVAVVRVAK
jgi:cell division protein FtsN